MLEIFSKYKEHCKGGRMFCVILFYFIFILERCGEREIETSIREKHQHQMAASSMFPASNQAHNLGMYHDQELNHQLLGAWVDAQPLGHSTSFG